MTNLMHASHQWANRPADETFTSLQDLFSYTNLAHQQAVGSTVPINTLSVESVGDTLYLCGKNGGQAGLTNWSFGQLCGKADAPTTYLRRLPSHLAAENLNHGLSKLDISGMDDEAKNVRLLLNRNGTTTLRAITSERYTRIWNDGVVNQLIQLQQDQPCWTLPKAYDRHNGTVGTPDADGMVTRGAYASDRDMFVFMVDEGREINVPGSNPVKRGFFVWNSEVGSKTFGIMTFIYDRVCGNNIVWGASDIKTVKIRHIGQADKRGFAELSDMVQGYAESSVKGIEDSIVSAQNTILGKNKDEVVEVLVAKRISPLFTKKRLEAAYDTASNVSRYGSPRSVWGMLNGLTENSQKETSNTDDRMEIDTAAGKLMDFVR